MAERDTIYKTKVKNKGTFDFKETYRILYEWLKGEDYDITEKSYKEVIGAGGAKEIEIEWEAKRKISDYFQFMIKLKWHMLGMTDAEVEINGVKQKVNKGQFEAEFEGILIKDYEHRWEKTPFFKFLRTLYDRYLIPGRIDQYETKLIIEVEEIVAQCKAFLALTGRR